MQLFTTEDNPTICSEKLTFFCFSFLLLVGACKSYFVALVLLSLRFAYDVK